MIVGYARVSTEDQTTDAQRGPLRAAGCVSIYQDIASGIDRDRPELARCLSSLKQGDVLVIVRLDRLARSLQHLLQIITDLKARGIGFRSLADQIDTETAQGRFMMHVLGAFAEFERELIRERTMAGLLAAKLRGAKSGNPKMRARDPIAIAQIKASLADHHLERSRASATAWIDLVSSLRPALSWKAVHSRLLRAHPSAPKSVDGLRNIVGRLVAAGDLPASVLNRASPPKAGDLAPIALAIKTANPAMPNRDLALELDRQGIHPLRGSSWTADAAGRLLRIAIASSRTTSSPS